MECKSTGTQLSRLLHGELRGIAAWRTRRHLRSCAGCSAEWRALQRLNALLLANDLVPADPPVPASASFFASHPKEAGSRIWRTIGSLAVIAGLTVGLLIFPRSPRNTSLASAVGQALRNVNVLHLRGWKRVDDKQIPWEIWRRKIPFFYHEQLGGRITQDDGRELVQIFPPEPFASVPEGLYLRTSSHPTTYRTGWDFPSLFANWRETMTPWQETRDVALFKMADYGMEGPGTITEDLYTVDKRTALPTRVEVRHGRTDSPIRTTSEILRAEYDVPLPQAFAALPRPNGSRVVDALRAPADPEAAREGAATVGGISIQARPLAMDAQGRVLLNVRGWLGSVRLGRIPAYPIGLRVQRTRQLEISDADLHAFHDDYGRDYVEPRPEGLGFPTHEDDNLMLLVPAEPLQAGAPFPHTLTLGLRVSPYTITPLSKRLLHETPLFDDNLTLTIALPQRTEPIDLDAHRAPDWRSHYLHLEEVPDEVTDAVARSDYYSDGWNKLDHSEQAVARRRKVVEWKSRALALCRPDTNYAQNLRLGLATVFQWIGDTQRASELLHQVIVESDRNPHLWDYYRKQAQQMQRLGQPSAR